jgi:hypothetical protein
MKMGKFKKSVILIGFFSNKAVKFEETDGFFLAFEQKYGEKIKYVKRKKFGHLFVQMVKKFWFGKGKILSI